MQMHDEKYYIPKMETDEKVVIPKEDDEDLEDGEIESDGEDAAAEEVTKEAEVTKNSKPESRPSENLQKSHVNEPAPVDEWAVRVEKAIANVLKKDGIEVAEPTEKTSPVKVAPGPSTPSQNKRPRESGGGRNDGEKLSKSQRRRKRRREDAKDSKRKSSKNDNKDEGVDDYEMLCVRGGSPPRREFDNESEHSYSSYSSYDSGDYRPQRKRQRDRRRGGGSSASGKHFDKRRQHHDSDNESRHQRKMELCKFYLMDCCAKREKCLYMHSDFPCKYYYLGLNCINRDTCKFSHGRPLTNQLRGILLKHLETAPKEILGDFPRLGRDHAVNMLNITHKKLTAEQEEIDSKNQKPRKSRWCGETRKKQSQPAKEDVLSLKHLTNVLTQDQISRMATMGIETLDQVQHLTFMQLTELGLSFQQLSEIQLNTMNFVKLGLVKGSDGEKGEEKESEKDEKEKQNEKQNEKVEETEKVKDVDMRMMEIASPDHEENMKKEQVVCNFLSPSPEGGEPGPNPDEPKLLIDESWYSDDEPPKEVEKSPSDTESSYWPPKPAVVEASDVSRVVGGSLSKIDYSSQILLPTIAPEPINDSISARDPRQIKEIDSPDKGTTRPSIYDQGPIGMEEMGDQDMRLPLFGTPELPHVDASMKDVDLRLPFKPLMTNYVPATEIDASLASHPPFPYKVVECDIPPPDYREIRKRAPAQGNTQDPRLRRILSLRDPEEEPEPAEAARAPAAATARLDPRRKREEAPKTAPPAGGIDIQQVLQKSPWYKDLGSKNKIMVNQQLALLSAELKRFAADTTPSKVFDMTVVTHNPTLQHILLQLGIRLSENGQFTLVEENQQQSQSMMDWMQPPIRPNFMPPATRPGLLGAPPMHPPPGQFDGFYNAPMQPDFFSHPPPGDINRPRAPFRGRSDRWSGRPGRRHFDSSRSGRRDKSSKN
ncbi:protein suppressor of sable isoform X2 [Lutzomyia longipalpis]|uniref:protein suppressor of sable isoform X2 n=1 Tax=Lutzomyia longipalpis TaxID=7200 RepID=UPI0024834167|nr:protein suppressor of sable isoform X2 [Lutzomyia longipalpis]